MSELALNGNQPSVSNVRIPDANPTRISNSPEYYDSGIIDAPTSAVNGATDDQHSDSPPHKKRKLTDDISSHKSSPRPPSPPWKKITADGPTTFLENGRRRSGRTNAVPLDRQPQSAQRLTRAAYEQKVQGIKKPGQDSLSSRLKAENVNLHKSPTDRTIRRGPGRPPKVKKEEGVIKAIPSATSPHSLRRTSTRITREPHSPVSRRNRHVKEEIDEPERVPRTSRLPSPPLILQKVKFRVALPPPSVLTPANAPLPKKYANLKEFLDIDPLDPFLGQDTLTSEQIRKEALARQRVYNAQQHGLLSASVDGKAQPDKQSEPRKQFAHFDHLLGHIGHFRGLLRAEKRDHRKKAEQIAHEAKKYVDEKRKRGRVKTAEELAQEQLEKMRIQYRSIVKDLEKLWLAVQTEVNAVRQRRFEEEQQAKLKSHLNRVLERTDEMLAKREESIMSLESDGGTDEPTEDESNGQSDSEDLSASDSDTEPDDERNDPDENLSAEQLKAKYEGLPDVERDVVEIQPAQDLDKADSTTEDSDPDIEMDSEFDSDNSEDEDEEDDDEEEPGGGNLLSLFFSKKEVAALAVQDSQPQSDADVDENAPPAEPGDPEYELPTDDIGADYQATHDLQNTVTQDTHIEDAEMQTHADSPASAIGGSAHVDARSDIDTTATTPQPMYSSPTAMEDMTSQDLSVQTSPHTSATKPSEPESISSPEPHIEITAAATPIDDKSFNRTQVPSLLRGTLREYQHEGLDWLAKLYANGRSGILADEMGLGKTIQSIALLAHLATEYEVWGPHLIVVPTSVMLNWEMEFKKFLPGFKILTYYGNLEERKQKRRGWMADDSFNVCITSYQLVLQDANSFKRRKWHYMILDEAHNIKNFRSERWQTMMTFNTRARLLLTGTPLQNNLTELWSLLFFLHYGQEGEDEDEAFAGLKEWSEWFKRPVESILEHGKQVLDQEDKEQVAKLHKVIRPFLLRRLKADVEKQMPAKYEHVEMCRLSKRQRQLYDGFMSRAQTKETLASGNYLSIINALMQLRKVCNHPDLFETRPINTSFAMPKSVAATFEIKDLLVRRKLFGGSPLDEIDLDFLQLVPISNEKISLIENVETVRRHAYHPFKALRDSQWLRVNRHAVASGQCRQDILFSLENIGRKARLQDIDRTMYYEAYRHHQRPIYGRGILQKLELGTIYEKLSRSSRKAVLAKSWATMSPILSMELILSIEDRSKQMEPFIQRYACVTPAVVATDFSVATVTEMGVSLIRQGIARRSDPFHSARMKLSIAFPDKRLLQFDCGKLQRLDKLLRNLQTGGHRALIFTQMTKVLDILEQFLNIHGHRYLRLDGATKIEQRQILTDRFNSDPRILCFILSSRSGGLGINLTGADTVIFYDLDWNPAMDRQCTDRAHRIGQTRDVHIYRFVSEHTIESNILRKANQKQLLDDVVIQEGDFTTDYLNKVTYRDMLDDQIEDDVAGAAMDRVLGNDKTAVAAFEQAEDQEDASAAKVAAKEVQHADDGDFEDKALATPRTGEANTPGPYGVTDTAIAEAEDAGIHHIDDYLIKLQTFLLKDVPLALVKDKSKRGRKKAEERRKRGPR